MSRGRSRRWRPAPFVTFSAGLHVAGAALIAGAPTRWPWIVGTLVADHLVALGAGLLPRTRLLGANLTRLPQEAADRGEVAITFDDGPHPEVTPALLDRLQELDLPATFFCVGRRAAEHPGIVAEIVRRGHQVGNHSHRHPNAFAFLGPAALRREIETAQDAIERAAGERPVLFRAPAGIRSPLLDPVLSGCGLHLASWTRRGFDTVSRDPARVARRLARSLAPGDVLLLHDGSSARDGQGRPIVLEVVSRLAEEISRRGLRAAPWIP